MTAARCEYHKWSICQFYGCDVEEESGRGAWLQRTGMMHLRAAQAGGRLAPLAPLMAGGLAGSAGASASALLAASRRTPALGVMRGPMVAPNNALNSIGADSPPSAWAAGLD